MKSIKFTSKIQWLLLVTLAFASTGCSMVVTEQVLEANKKVYAEATKSILSTNGGTLVDHDLDAIGAEDEDGQGYVNVVAWKSAKSANDYYNAPGNPDTLNSRYLTWVVQSAQYTDLAKDLRLEVLSGQKLALRLEQALGLPPTADTTKVFLVIKVKRSDLFRPCADPSVNDCACTREFPAGFYSSDTTFRAVYTEIVKQTEGYPWTRLGYTLDWKPGQRTPFGFSEYIVRQGAVVWIEAKTPTEAWIKQQVGKP